MSVVLHCFLCREVLYQDGPNGTPIVTGLSLADGSTVTADAYVAALDVPGAKKLIPDAWRNMKMVRHDWKEPFEYQNEELCIGVLWFLESHLCFEHLCLTFIFRPS